MTFVSFFSRVAGAAVILVSIGFAGASEASGTSLRFYGHGTGDIDRVKIPLDSPPRTADVSGDFTLEWWMKANLSDNVTPLCTPGEDNWITGNVVFDRDVFGAGDYGDYGISLRGGRLAFGVHNGTSGTGICGSTNVADGNWHHIAVTRNGATGEMRIYVDGVLDGSGSGPTGDISYRDGRPTSYPSSDPYLVIGAEKHDAGPSYPSFRGWIDEVRLSTSIRYTANFTPPSGPFTPGSDTVLLYHFDEGSPGTPCTGTVTDSSFGAQNPGQCQYGGSAPAGPIYSADTPFGPPLRDVAVLPVRPLKVRIPASGQVVSKRVPIKVRNASEFVGSDVTVQLNATIADCPPSVIAVGPDFDPSTPAQDPTVTVGPKKVRRALMTLSFDPADFSTPNSLAPVRCRVDVVAATLAPPGAIDPSPSNNQVTLEISVLDAGDVSAVNPVHENVLKSFPPVTLRIGKNQTGKSRNLSVQVTNADSGEPAGDSLQVTMVSTDCPTGAVGNVDFEAGTPGDQDTVTVVGRKSRTGKLMVNFLAADVMTLNRWSPTRCVARLKVTGPGTDPEPSNNEADLVIDVYDANDF